MTSNPAELHQGEMIACHECDFLHTVQPVPAGGKALCSRCGALLYRHIPNSLDRALALNLAALMLFIMANAFPLMSLKLSGRSEENVLLSGAMALYRLGMGEVGVLVFLTSFFFPLVGIVGLLYVLFPLKFGYRAWGMAPVYRLVQAVTPWSLIGVFMLGVLVAIVKLLDMATIIPGISLYSFAALLVVVTAARANLDPAVIWWRMGCKPTVNGAGTTAVERDSVNCHTCSLLVSKASLGGYGHGTCPRCGSFLHSRKVNSVARTWALIFAAALLFIP
ncbi:MAG: paraquat-inducible protein A, partial [Gammaproteobacteria bacterium]|nr:paraquat-inducible protein A [Gammaproteobacteria bacterium]